MSDLACIDRPFGAYRAGDNSRWSHGNISLRDLVEYIRSDADLADLTARYRDALNAAPDSRHRDYIKKSKSNVLEGVTVSALPVHSPFGGVIPREDAGDPTGLFGFDLDKMMPEVANDFRHDLSLEPWCLAAWVTVSGCGVYAVVEGPVVDGEDHSEMKEAFKNAWLEIAEERFEPIVEFLGEVDPAPSNFASLRFVSHDAEAFLRGAS